MTIVDYFLCIFIWKYIKIIIFILKKLFLILVYKKIIKI
jgi:hypothetical protein